MKQSLDIRLGQHLTITPQLQQAIRLLQLSTQELQQEIQQALESNPLLEGTDTEYEDGNGETPETDTSETNEREADAEGSETDLVDELEWGDLTASSAPGDDDDLPDFESRNSLPVTLKSHLLWQLQMSPVSETDFVIAEALIDAINDDGYLTSPMEDICEVCTQATGEPVEVEEIAAVLHQIQNFDPLGVGARSLAECLKLQLRALAGDTPGRDVALLLCEDGILERLGKRDYQTLRKQLKLRPEELQDGVTLIQSLNPKPGASLSTAHADYIVPEVLVRKSRGVWRAELNSAAMPRVRLHSQYLALVRRGDQSPQNRFLQDHLQSARWFLKSLRSRNDTLLKVARTIVDTQRAFFDHGPEAMKPLVLHDVAEGVGMHESTISRVTTNKYMWTPRGIFELKYFFSSHVSTTDGGACSATAIRSLIKKMIDQESSAKPVSDSQIAETLEQQGINIARRTIAKYRESLNIPPSHQRKSLL